MVVCGDFDLPRIDRLNSKLSTDFISRDSTTASTRESASALLNYINFTNLYQFNFIPNSANSYLDLFFTSISETSVAKAPDSLVKRVDLYHPPLDCTVKLDLPVSTGLQLEKRNFYKADYDKIKLFEFSELGRYFG